jgi:hypothetical protein
MEQLELSTPYTLVIFKEIGSRGIFRMLAALGRREHTRRREAAAGARRTKLSGEASEIPRGRRALPHLPIASQFAIGHDF